MIEFILKKGDVIMDRDLLSFPAAKELIVGAVIGLESNPKEHERHVFESLEAIMGGQTVEFENAGAGTSFIFQLHRGKKH